MKLSDLPFFHSGAKMSFKPGTKSGPSVDSEGEIGSEGLNSSESSTSSSGSSSFSDESAAAAPAAGGVGACRPHRASDPAWAAIRSGSARVIGARDFKLVRRIGSGDMGTVYLCRLRDDPRCAYAMKVVDRELVAKKMKVERAETEKRILRKLDHPFLPTLYADFEAAPHYSCVVMEYCSGGDLHSLRHRQPDRRFNFTAARFYAAEVLLALEYLHMLGIVYRDLKPENVLIRSDGHIMLSDFDLSLQSTAVPTVDLPVATTTSKDPSCLPDRLFCRPVPPPTARFVAEPTAARSSSFVGTHEYVAPEVAGGRAHGSAVDWWAYGVFLYELLYGRTPFAGPTNADTLHNIVRRPLAFPPTVSGSRDGAARDLIGVLLAKDPAARLGSRRGAADVRAHPFFKGLNLALMRSCRPPFVPALDRVREPDRFQHF